MSRRCIVLDCETTGLDLDHDRPLEVGWQDYATGEHGVFVPPHDVEQVLARAEPKALEINGYRERIMLRPQDDGTEVLRLYEVLVGATLVGSAPAIDCAMLVHLFREHRAPELRPWHHRVVDLASYAAGRLGLPLHEVEGLWRLSELLGVERPDHGALSDVRSTIACLRALEALPHASGEHATLADGTVLRDRTAGSLGLAGGVRDLGRWVGTNGTVWTREPAGCWHTAGATRAMGERQEPCGSSLAEVQATDRAIHGGARS